VDPAQPSLATAAGPLPIPAPSPPHRVVPQRSMLLLLPRVSPKVAGLRHPNRASKIDLWGYVRVATTSPPQTTYLRMPRTSRPPWVIAVSFRSMRSSQLPVGGEPRTPPQQRPLLTIDEAATYLNVPARWVADAVRQRKVRCTRIGKHIRFRVEHLDELVAAGEQPVTSDVIPIQRNRTRSKL
jgi:excisionase family DNA binding protein